MIPTREQIDEHYSVNALAWLRAMRDEIDRLTAENDRLQPKVCCGDFAECSNSNCVPMLRHKIDRANTDAALARDALAKATAAKDGAYAERDRLVSLVSKVFPSWLGRHPHTDESWDDDWRWIVFVQLPTGQASWHIHDTELEWFKHLRTDGYPEWDGHTTEQKYGRVAAVETDRAPTVCPPFEGDPKDCAFKTTPAPEREAAIRAWEKEAMSGQENPNSHPDAPYIITRSEITAAVALMRSAGDPDAKLRELRAKLVECGYLDLDLPMRKIDEMLARPAPVEPCKECEGTKSITKVDWPGETSNMYQEPCPECTPKPAPVEPPKVEVNRFDERANELRSMRSWIEYQPCLRDGLASEVVKSYLAAKIKELDDQSDVPVEQPAAAVPVEGTCDEILQLPRRKPNFASPDEPEAVSDSKYSPASEVKAWDDRISAQFAAIATLVKNGDTKDAIELCHGGRVMCEEAADRILTILGAPTINHAGAVPDDTRELVAQLADAVVTLCDGQGFGATLSEVQAIAARLRGGA